MDNMIDCLNYEHFSFEELQGWGSEPLRLLSDKMMEENSIDEQSQTAHWAFCNILWEKIHEMDEVFKRLVEEEAEALKVKREAAA